MVEVFKTNVQKRKQSKVLLSVLTEAFPSCKINFDLADCDKILRVEGEGIEVKKIIMLVRSRGIRCEPLD